MPSVRSIRPFRWSFALGCCAIVAVAINAWADAQPRAALSGYGNIRFGMREADLRNATAFLDEVDATDSGTWLTGRDAIDMAGGRFALRVLIDQGVVRRISLLDLAPVPKPDCRPGFDRMVAYVEAQYGAPDLKGKDVPQIVRETYTAKFKFADGAQIEVHTFLNGNGRECGNSVVFFVPQDAPQDKTLAPSDA